MEEPSKRAAEPQKQKNQQMNREKKFERTQQPFFSVTVFMQKLEQQVKNQILIQQFYNALDFELKF